MKKHLIFESPAETATPTRHVPAIHTIPEVAHRTGRHPRTVRKWIKRGVLEGLKLGGRTYVTQEALEALLSGNTPQEAK